MKGDFTRIGRTVWIVSESGQRHLVVEVDISNHVAITVLCEQRFYFHFADGIKTIHRYHGKFVSVWTRQSIRDQYTLRIEIPFTKLQDYKQRKIKFQRKRAHIRGRTGVESCPGCEWIGRNEKNDNL